MGNLFNRNRTRARPRPLRFAGQGENLDDASYNKLPLMGLKPWAQLFCPFGFGAQTLYPSLMLTRMGDHRTERRAHCELERARIAHKSS